MALTIRTATAETTTGSHKLPKGMTASSLGKGKSVALRVPPLGLPLVRAGWKPEPKAPAFSQPRLESLRQEQIRASHWPTPVENVGHHSTEPALLPSEQVWNM
jgi:hypothetical protein